MTDLRPRAALAVLFLCVAPLEALRAGPSTDPAPAQEGAGADPELEALRGWVDEIRPQVERLRGLAFQEPVALEIASAQDFRDYAERQMELVGDAEDRATVERVVKLLGLFPVEGDLWEAQLALLTGQVGGYYDPGRESFALMEGVGGALARTVLSHELVHALEDQHYGLGDRLVELADRTDRAAAYHAVVEGTATLVANRWMLEHGSEFSFEELLDLTETNPLVQMLEAEPVLWVPTVFSYMGGQVFLHQSGSLLGAASQRFDVARLDRAFREPPVSTEQVLHPEKYWDAETLDLPSEVAFPTPEGWEQVHEDVLGEVQLALVAWGDAYERPDADNPAALFGLDYTNEAATGWDGDRLVLLERGDRRLLLLATHWDSPEDRDQWHAALEARLAEFRSAAAALGATPQRAGAGEVTLVQRGRTEHVLAVLSRPAGGDEGLDLRTLAEQLELQVRAEPPTPADERGR